MLKPGVLFSVPVEELDLESGVICEKYVRCRHLKIRTEKDLPYDLVAAPQFRDHDLDIAFEGLAVDSGAVKGDLFAFDVCCIPDEHVIPKIMNVDGSVKLFGTSPACLAWAGVEILQDSVITQSAHHIEPELRRARDKIIACEQAVADKNVRDAEELVLMIEYRLEALCRLIVAFLLHVFKIERRAPPGGERNRLYREKESRVTDSGDNLRETENLKTPFGTSCAPRPVSAESWSLLAGFAEKAVVKRDGDPVSVSLKKHSYVKGAPVELLLEVLSEAALAGVSVSGHRQEIQSTVYCQYQNHCLDEESFEIFSYLCGLIERGCDNRPYLVKWLNFIHNLLDYNCKVTKNLALDQILLTLISLETNRMNIFYSMSS